VNRSVTDTLDLRRATPQDAYALWLWANDADTRAGSRGRDLIEWDEHIRWLNEQVTSDAAMIYVAESADRRPVASIRFDTRDGWQTARLSYVVAPESRGRGISNWLIRSGVDSLLRDHPSATVVAHVLQRNAASLRVFRNLGWREHQDATSGESHFTLASS
jgi:RimJ/RimL family protein N-acetyltransferase